MLVILSSSVLWWGRLIGEPALVLCFVLTVLPEEPLEWPRRSAHRPAALSWLAAAPAALWSGAAARAGQRPLVTYRTMDIQPGVAVLRTEGDLAHNGLPHVTDSPARTVYVPMHLRGRDREHASLHHYRVHGPAGGGRSTTDG